MSTADGSVLGNAQIFGGAPRNRAFNVVMLADGFTAAQQNDFNNACAAFVTAFTGTPPFDELKPAINVFRVNVTSTDSGADDPASAGGTGATARTYFDSTFGSNGIRRLLTCNNTTALQTAAAQIPEFTVAIVVVNSTVYGGSGGSVGTYSLAGGATEIAIHEMGHTAFHLADEYPYYAGGAETGHDHHPAGEPAEPNVTTNTNRATLKWGWAVAAATAIPTMSNPSLRDRRQSSQPGAHRNGRAVRRRALLPLRRLSTGIRLQDAQPGGAVLPRLPAGDLEQDRSTGHAAGACPYADQCRGALPGAYGRVRDRRRRPHDEQLVGRGQRLGRLVPRQRRHCFAGRRGIAGHGDRPLCGSPRSLHRRHRQSRVQLLVGPCHRMGGLVPLGRHRLPARVHRQRRLPLHRSSRPLHHGVRRQDHVDVVGRANAVGGRGSRFRAAWRPRAQP